MIVKVQCQLCRRRIYTSKAVACKGDFTVVLPVHHCSIEAYAKEDAGLEFPEESQS